MCDMDSVDQSTGYLIYQMGKVGSSSLVIGLREAYGKDAVRHIHAHKQARQELSEFKANYQQTVVVTGFREPLSRCISAYFQNLTNRDSHWFVGDQNEVINRPTAWLINDYNSKAEKHVRSTVRSWLHHYEQTTNSKFIRYEKMNGFWRFSKENVTFYIYTIEAISDFLEAARCDPLLRKMVTKTTNQAKTKWYAELYKNFIEQYRLHPMSYCRIYGNIDFLAYLYSEDQIIEMTKQFFADPTDGLIHRAAE
jgi:hypothetical protein